MRLRSGIINPIDKGTRKLYAISVIVAGNDNIEVNVHALPLVLIFSLRLIPIETFRPLSRNLEVHRYRPCL